MERYLLRSDNSLPPSLPSAAFAKPPEALAWNLGGKRPATGQLRLSQAWRYLVLPVDSILVMPRNMKNLLKVPVGMFTGASLNSEG
jgi:hypothetical protein